MQHFSFTFLSFLSVLFAFSLFSWCGILAFVVLPLSPFRSFVGVFLASVVLPSCAVFAFGSYPSSGVLVLPVCFAFVVLSSCAVSLFQENHTKRRPKRRKQCRKEGLLHQGQTTKVKTAHEERSTKARRPQQEKLKAKTATTSISPFLISF